MSKTSPSRPLRTSTPKGLRCWGLHLPWGLHLQLLLALPRDEPCLTMTGSCPWEHLPDHGGMKMQNCPGNKPSDRRIWEFNAIFLIWSCLLLWISVLCSWLGQKLIQCPFQETTWGKLYMVGRFPCPHGKDERGFPKRQRWCLSSLSCSSLGPLQRASGPLLVGRTKWASCTP